MLLRRATRRRPPALPQLLRGLASGVRPAGWEQLCSPEVAAALQVGPHPASSRLVLCPSCPGCFCELRRLPPFRPASCALLLLLLPLTHSVHLHHSGHVGTAR